MRQKKNSQNGVRKNAKARLISHYSCQTTKCPWRVSGKYSMASLIWRTVIFCEAMLSTGGKKLALYAGSNGKLTKSQTIRWRGNKVGREKKKDAYWIDTNGGLLFIW